MPKSKPAPTWVRYCPDQPLLRLVSVSSTAELAHRRFADYHWSTGLWPRIPPADGPALARVPPEAWAGLLRELRPLGWRLRRGHLLCPAVAAVRATAVRACQAVRAAGSRGGTVASQRRQVAQAPLPASLPASPPAPLPAYLPQIKIKIKKEKGDSLSVERLNGKPFSDSTPNDESVTGATATLSPLPLLQKPQDETFFLQELTEVLESWKTGASAHELANWGGWWRNRFRENPDKARRVLAEIRCMIRERAVHGNPGAAAVDLWNRLP